MDPATTPVVGPLQLLCYDHNKFSLMIPEDTFVEQLLLFKIFLNYENGLHLNSESVQSQKATYFNLMHELSFTYEIPFSD